MAGLANGRNTPELADGGRMRVLPVEANTNVYLGGIVALDAAGNAVPAAASVSPTVVALRIIGRAEMVLNGIPGENALNNPGAAGAISIVARKGVFLFDNATGLDAIAAANVGSECFALDDHTVSMNDRASGDTVQTRAAAGQIVAIDASGGIWVDFWHQSISAT
ncbi:MAG TPA: hypothetical protein VMV27_01915 [Candidatus Binataceae bacterium]|nr:hypothetical protein [Candidatus Binataceae bacterium]